MILTHNEFLKKFNEERKNYNIENYTDDILFNNLFNIYNKVIEKTYHKELVFNDGLFEILFNEFKFSTVKVNITSKDIEGLKREVLIPIRFTLYETACLILSTLRADGTKEYNFTCDNFSVVNFKDNENEFFDFKTINASSVSVLLLLDYKFEFIYDLEDKWEFSLEVNKESIDKETFEIVDASYYGIWEKNKMNLIDFIEDNDKYYYGINDYKSEYYIGKISDSMNFDFYDSDLIKLNNEVNSRYNDLLKIYKR